jgi:hypothetical protein
MGRPSTSRTWLRRVALIACTLPIVALQPRVAIAAVKSPSRQAAPRSAPSAEGGSSLEDAAAKAGNTGRSVAMSLIGLALAVAGIVLAFKRDFKEAAGVFAVGIIAVLLATPSGVSLLKDTVASLFGGS